GIRDFHVTGVQTCALPIWGTVDLPANTERAVYFNRSVSAGAVDCEVTDPAGRSVPTSPATLGFDDTAMGATFRTGDAGTYTVECDLPSDVSSTLTVAPPLLASAWASASWRSSRSSSASSGSSGSTSASAPAGTEPAGRPRSARQDEPSRCQRNS